MPAHLAKRPHLRPPRTEALYWAISIIVGVVAVILWRSEGYWLWKSQGHKAWAYLMVPAMAPCGIFPLLVVVAFGFWRKELKYEIVRAFQIWVPLTLLGLSIHNIDEGKKRLDFEHHLGGRERVVEMFRDSEQTRWAKTYPLSIPHLAADNEVWVLKRDGEYMVWFPILMWGIDNHRGFVYSESGREPPRRSFLETVMVGRIDDHWFWIGTS